MGDHMHQQYRIATRRAADLRRSAWLILAIALAAGLLAGLVAWLPGVAGGASAASMLGAGCCQLGRSDAFERSTRVYSGMIMIVAGAWCLLLAATGRSDWLIAASACAAAAAAGWLVWVPHSHPALVRASTGFGDLDPATAHPGQSA